MWKKKQKKVLRMKSPPGEGKPWVKKRADHSWGILKKKEDGKKRIQGKKIRPELKKKKFWRRRD